MSPTLRGGKQKDELDQKSVRHRPAATAGNPDGIGIWEEPMLCSQGGVPYNKPLLDAKDAEIERLRALVLRLRLEAQGHAQEARTANGTIREAYQVVTGATGEPGNWNGAEPIREEINRLKGGLRKVREYLDESRVDDASWTVEALLAE